MEVPEFLSDLHESGTGLELVVFVHLVGLINCDVFLLELVIIDVIPVALELLKLQISL